MIRLDVLRDKRTIDLKVTTDDEVTSFRGTPFVPNHATVQISGTQIISIILERLDEYGYGTDDPAGPDGAELNASFGGGEFLPEHRSKLPTVAQDALAEIEGLIKR